jgi:hypothetical protein
MLCPEPAKQVTLKHVVPGTCEAVTLKHVVPGTCEAVTLKHVVPGTCEAGNAKACCARNLRSRWQNKAWGARPRKRGTTKGVSPRSGRQRCRPFHGLGALFLWTNLGLAPRLYAFAHFAG